MRVNGNKKKKGENEMKFVKVEASREENQRVAEAREIF